MTKVPTPRDGRITTQDISMGGTPPQLDNVDLSIEFKTGSAPTDVMNPYPLYKVQDSSEEVDPSTVGNIVLEYDHSTIVGITPGDPLTTWSDEGPNNKDAIAPGGSEPTYTSKGVYFEYAQMMDIDYVSQFSTLDAITMMVVATPVPPYPNSSDGTTDYDNVLVGGVFALTNTSSLNSDFSMRLSAGFSEQNSGDRMEGICQMETRARTSGVTVGGSRMFGQQGLWGFSPTVYTYSSSAENILGGYKTRSFINGHIVDTQDFKATPNDIVDTPNKLRIGTLSTVGGDFVFAYKGFIQHIIIFDKVLTDSETYGVIKYLKNKWDIFPVPTFNSFNDAVWSLVTRKSIQVEIDREVNALPDNSGSGHVFENTNENGAFYRNEEINKLGSLDFNTSSFYFNRENTLGEVWRELDEYCLVIHTARLDSTSPGSYLLTLSSSDSTSSDATIFGLRIFRSNSSTKVGQITLVNLSDDTGVIGDGFFPVGDNSNVYFSTETTNPGSVTIVECSTTPDIDGDRTRCYHNGHKLWGTPDMWRPKDHPRKNDLNETVLGGRFNSDLSDNVDRHFDGHLTEMYLFDRTLTDVEKESICDYFYQVYYNSIRDTSNSVFLQPGDYRFLGKLSSGDFESAIQNVEVANGKSYWLSSDHIPLKAAFPSVSFGRCESPLLQGRLFLREASTIYFTQGWDVNNFSSGEQDFGKFNVKSDARQTVLSFYREDINEGNIKPKVLLDANLGVTFNVSNELESWNDQSHFGNHAFPGSISPEVTVEEDTNNLIVFAGNTGFLHFISPVINIRVAIFVIFEEPLATDTFPRSLLCDEVSTPWQYRSESTDSTPKAFSSDQLDHPMGQNAVVRINGSSPVDPLTTVFPTVLSVVTIEYDHNFIPVSRFGNDRDLDSGSRVWHGKLGYLELYSESLSPLVLNGKIDALKTRFNIV